MKVHYIVGSIVGAALIHFAMAACSSNRDGVASADIDAGSGNASDAAPESDGDGITAGETGKDFEVSEEPCDKTYELPILGPGGDGGPRTQTVYYAEHAYPGKSSFEIAAHVRHWTKIVDPAHEARPQGFDITAQVAVYTRDGVVGAGCARGTTTYFIWH